MEGERVLQGRMLQGTIRQEQFKFEDKMDREATRKITWLYSKRLDRRDISKLDYVQLSLSGLRCHFTLYLNLLVESNFATAFL